MSKEVIFGKEARRRIREGVDMVGDAVRITMGHRGRAVIIQKGTPVWTLDGVTVAESIDSLEDEFQNMGAQVVKKVARKTNDLAGDGTTTATLLTQTLVKGGIDGIELGLDPVVMRRAMDEGASVVLGAFKALSREVKTHKELMDVATVSSREKEVGKIVAGLFHQIGKEGIITTEEVKDVGIKTEIVKGMQVDTGWSSPYFINNKERQSAVVKKPLVLVTTQRIATNEDVVPVLQLVELTDSKSLVIIAEEVVGEALATCVANQLRGTFKICVIRAPGFGETKKEHLLDICAVTGATLISEETATRVSEVTKEQLGAADTIIAQKGVSAIIGGKGKKADIEARVAQLRKEASEVVSNYKKLNLEKRAGKMAEGVAIIRIGAVTEDEAKEQMYRVEDAVNATRSAMEEGVVEGGGMAMWRASEALDPLIEETKDASYRYGLELVRRAVRKPAQQILENEGKNADVVLALGRKVGKEVIDPAKVGRVALEQAISTAGLFVITGAAVAEKPELKKPKS